MPVPLYMQSEQKYKRAQAVCCAYLGARQTVPSCCECSGALLLDDNLVADRHAPLVERIQVPSKEDLRTRGHRHTQRSMLLSPWCPMQASQQHTTSYQQGACRAAERISPPAVKRADQTEWPLTTDLHIPKRSCKVPRLAVP